MIKLLKAAFCFALVLGVATAQGRRVLALNTEIVYGPGLQPQLHVRGPSDVRVLEGTEIVMPNIISSTARFNSADDAIIIEGEGNSLQIDGGYFKGGDSTYTGPMNLLANALGGHAAFLEHAVAEIHGGTFVGGNATTANYRAGHILAGLGLFVDESILTIYDGLFRGGVTTRIEFLGDVRMLRAAAIQAYNRSRINLHGGMFEGYVVLNSGSSLSVFGTDLTYEDSVVRGYYLDGTPLELTVYNSGGGVFFNQSVPEPATLPILCCGLAAAVLWRRHTWYAKAIG